MIPIMAMIVKAVVGSAASEATKDKPIDVEKSTDSQPNMLSQGQEAPTAPQQDTQPQQEQSQKEQPKQTSSSGSSSSSGLFGGVSGAAINSAASGSSQPIKNLAISKFKDMFMGG